MAITDTLKTFLSTLKSSVYGLGNHRSQADVNNIMGALSILFGLALLGETLPYEYYITLRTVVCLCMGYILYKHKEQLPKEYCIGLFIGMVLYNPIYPVHLGNQLSWFIINLLTLFAIYKIHLNIMISNKEKKLK